MPPTMTATRTLLAVLGGGLALAAFEASGAAPDGGALASQPADAGAAQAGRCPSDMVRVADSCMDPYEASLTRTTGAGKAVSRKGAVPEVRVTFDSAASACAAAGKRLCKKSEWITACRGPKRERRYPYGTAFEEKRCMGWATRDPKAKAGPAPSGSFPACRSVELEIYDLSGNVFEWIDEPAPGGLRPICGGSFNNAGNDLGCSCGELERPDKR
jgi:formylglycine-generating enzyme required for sulfatase activity